MNTMPTHEPAAASASHDATPSSVKFPAGMKNLLLDRLPAEGVRSMSELIVKACQELLARPPSQENHARQVLLERASEYSEAKSAAIDMKRDVFQALTGKLGYAVNDVVIDPRIQSAGRTLRADFGLPGGATVLVRGTGGAMERTLGEAVLLRGATGHDVYIVVPYIVQDSVREVAKVLGDVSGISLLTMEQLLSDKSPLAQKHSGKKDVKK